MWPRKSCDSCHNFQFGWSPVEEEMALSAAAFRAEYKLPYADCFAAALAKLYSATVITADADFKLVEKIVDVVSL